jgi:hypothetical protein
MSKPKPIHRQLMDAYEAKGLTWDELIRLADLKCSADSISRKLRGKKSLRSREIEALAKALRIQVTTGQEAA